ncbi:MAG: hypothetical protein AAFV53_39910, partial [Myxococcota bacterium]
MLYAQQVGGGGNAMAQELLAQQQGPDQGGASSPAGALGPERCSDPTMDEFTQRFNTEFASILHVFGMGDQAMGALPEGRRRVEPGSQSGDGLTAAHLEALFTREQRDALIHFMYTRRIPERLFNVDDIGGATAQQRILISAHILANGEYSPGSFVQGVHARMCFHWVHITHHYAGATPGQGPLAENVMGNFDHEGNVVLGSGSTESQRGERVYAEDLPDTETPGGVGPIPEGSGQERLAERERARRAEDPEARRAVHRRTSLPFSDVLALRPGDWVWYYNANGSGGGVHSAIFSRWGGRVEGSPESGQYRRGIFFSQRGVSDGGQEHAAWLGDRYMRVDNHGVYPVTSISRVSPDAHPATTPEALLPHFNRRRQAGITRGNEQLLRRLERRYGRPIDLERLRDWIREENEQLIVSLEGGAEGGGRSRLTDGQGALLRQTNGLDALDSLVHLNQRLHAIVDNAALLEDNEDATYEGRLNDRHEQASEDAEREQGEAQDELNEIDELLAPIYRALAEQNGRLAEIDLRPTIRDMRRRIGRIWRRMGDLPRGEARDQLRDERRELQQRVAALETAQRQHRPEIRGIEAEIRRLEQSARPHERRRRRVTRRMAQIERALPYGLVHPGRL